MRTIRVNFTRSCFKKAAVLITIYFLFVYKYYQYPKNQIKLSGKMEKGNKYYKYNYIEASAIHPDAGPKKSSHLLINLTDFKFLQNNRNICYKNRLYNQLLLVLVHSARSHLEERSRIRQILGSFKTLKGWDIRLAFILGKKNSSSVKEDFTLEPTDDLIVGNFEDTYRNLTYKHAMTYKWTVEFCPDAKFLAKIDDDVYINFVKYLQEIMFRQIKYQKRVISCRYFKKSPPMRDKYYKNYISFQDYSGNFFPPYCSGPAYLIDMESVKLIYESTLEMKFFIVDDVWITGIIRIKRQIGIRYFFSFDNYVRVNYTQDLLSKWRDVFAKQLLYNGDFKAKFLLN